MTTPADFREHALDCLRWAEDAKDAGQRDTLLGIAHMWMNTAIVVDQYVALAGDTPARSIRAARKAQLGRPSWR
jgi:hypothetical protein